MPTALSGNAVGAEVAVVEEDIIVPPCAMTLRITPIASSGEIMVVKFGESVGADGAGIVTVTVTTATPGSSVGVALADGLIVVAEGLDTGGMVGNGTVEFVLLLMGPPVTPARWNMELACESLTQAINYTRWSTPVKLRKRRDTYCSGGVYHGQC